MTGEQFSTIREELGLSQGELAQVLGMSGKQALSNIETGRRKPGKLLSMLMRAFSELPEKRSKELRELLAVIARRESKSSKGARR